METNQLEAIYLMPAINNGEEFELQPLPMTQEPSGSFLALEVVDKENTESRLQELSQNPHIWDRAVQLQDLLFSSTLSDHEALLEAGFCDVIYEPEKYFSEYHQTPTEMGLDDSIESVNKVLKDGFYGDEWNIAFTVTPAEIQQYLKNHQH